MSLCHCVITASDHQLGSSACFGVTVSGVVVPGVPPGERGGRSYYSLDKNGDFGHEVNDNINPDKKFDQLEMSFP